MPFGVAPKKMVVAGASGLIGCAVLKRLGNREDWDIVAVSRRPPFVPLGKAKHLSVDLTDPAACREAFGDMRDVTHLVYTAVNEKADDIVAGWFDEKQVALNMAMLENLFEPLIKVAKGFQHVSLVHGAKAYGNHLGGAPIPMKESLPRRPHNNFYLLQEDYIAARAAGRPWSYTVMRPVGIAGDAIGANMNSFLSLAVFAALRKEAGLDLPMPGGGVCAAIDCCDADLLAEGLEWAAGAIAARNQIFNISNGDLLATHSVFPVIAAEMKMELSQPHAYDIGAEFQKLAHLWPGIVRKYRLKAPEDLEALLGTSVQLIGGWSAVVPDGNPLSWGALSTIKIRQAGFGACMDTLEMVAKYMRRYQELGLIPPV